MISYMTRINYGAVIAEMVESTGFTKSVLSMAVTGGFITYAAGQIFCGIIGDRLSPKFMITFGLLLTASMNLLIPFQTSPYAMLVIWCFNGIGQAFMWPPIVRVASTVFSESEYKKAIMWISWGASFGTIAVYLMSPLLIALSGWKLVFIVSASLAFLMVLLWLLFFKEKEIKVKLEENSLKKRHELSSKLSESNAKAARKLLFQPAMIAIFFAIIFHGALRDSVMTWMPSFINETYHLGTKMSILTGVIIPVFSMVIVAAATWYSEKKSPNPAFAGGLFFSLSVIATTLLIFTIGKIAPLSIFGSAVVSGSMHGVNFFLVSIVPMMFARYGRASTVSGLLNASAYLGSAVSTYGIAAVTENVGWGSTVYIWLLFAAVGTILCFVAAKPFEKRMKRA